VEGFRSKNCIVSERPRQGRRRVALEHGRPVRRLVTGWECRRAEAAHASFSADSWGVDYVLYDGRGKMMPPVWHYRDARTARGVENARARVDWPTIYAETGIQFMALNTIYQLAAEPPERLAQAKQLLLIGDAFNYYCCGVAKTRNRSPAPRSFTTRARNPGQKLLDALGFPKKCCAVFSGTKQQVERELAMESVCRGWRSSPRVRTTRARQLRQCGQQSELGLPQFRCGRSWAWNASAYHHRSGTRLNFTNEIGFGGTVRLLRTSSDFGCRNAS
jgi:rhamnulokinase